MYLLKRGEQTFSKLFKYFQFNVHIWLFKQPDLFQSISEAREMFSHTFKVSFFAATKSSFYELLNRFESRKMFKKSVKKGFGCFKHHSNLKFISHFVTFCTKKHQRILLKIKASVFMIYLYDSLVAFVVKILTNFMSLAVYDTAERRNERTGAKIYYNNFSNVKLSLSLLLENIFHT